MNRTLTLTITAALLALGVTAAQAAIYTEYVDVAPTTQGTGGSLTFNIAQFDPSLGTLNSVGLTFTPVIGDIGYSVYNASGSPETVNSAVSNPNGTLADANSLGLNASWSSSQNFSSANFTAAPGINTGSLPFSVFTITPSSVTAAAAGFTGMGTYILTMDGSALATSSGSPGTPILHGWYGNVGGDLEVDFNYTIVPEPSCLALMALGGCLFGWRMLKRK